MGGMPNQRRATTLYLPKSQRAKEDGLIYWDSVERRKLERQSKDHLRALLRYGVKYGLPRMSPLDCQRKLNSMGVQR